MGAAFLLGIVTNLSLNGLASAKVILILLLFSALSLYRMHHFGRLYAEQLFIEFLQLSTRKVD